MIEEQVEKIVAEFMQEWAYTVFLDVKHVVEGQPLEKGDPGTGYKITWTGKLRDGTTISGQDTEFAIQNDVAYFEQVSERAPKDYKRFYEAGRLTEFGEWAVGKAGFVLPGKPDGFHLVSSKSGRSLTGLFVFFPGTGRGPGGEFNKQPLIGLESYAYQRNRESLLPNLKARLAERLSNYGEIQQ